MTITEIVFPNFKPESAEEAFRAVPTIAKVLDSVPVIQFHGTGHILRHNGTDVSHGYRPLANLVWDNVNAFHEFYPNSEEFKAFVGPLMPFLAAPAAPKLWEPAAGYGSSDAIWKGPVYHILVGKLDKSRTRVQVLQTWKKVIGEVDGGEANGRKDWFGYGLEGDEGSWVGVLRTDGVEGIGEEGMKDLGDVESWVVRRMDA